MGKGAKEVFDISESKKTEVERTLRSVKGLVSNTLARTGEGGLAVTVCQDQAGIEESAQKAKDFVAKHAAHAGVSAPQVTKGSVIVHLD